MEAPKANSGDMIHIRPLDSVPAGIQLITLVKTPAMEVKRLALPKGRQIPPIMCPKRLRPNACKAGSPSSRAP